MLLREASMPVVAHREVIPDAQNQAVIDHFRDSVERCEPYLYELADQVLEAAPEQNWDLLVGDDTSGRMVTRFLRVALENEGYAPETCYLNVSKRYRDAANADVTNEYVERIAQRYEDEPRVLLVSESAESFDTIRHMQQLFFSYSQSIDAAVTATKAAPEDIRDMNLFIGGLGQEAATAIFDTFEKVSVVSRKQQALDVIRRSKVLHRIVRMAIPQQQRAKVATYQSTYQLTNLESAPEQSLPVAVRTPDTQYRQAAHFCYEHIRDVANKYSANRN